MAYIKVDHSKFSAAASEVDSYVSFMKKKMMLANAAVDSMSSNWVGVDATQFKTEWEKVTNGDSTYSQMIEALESYSEFLRYAASKYKQAQIDAVNRSDDLLNWW